MRFLHLIFKKIAKNLLTARLVPREREDSQMVLQEKEVVEHLGKADFVKKEKEKQEDERCVLKKHAEDNIS